MVEDIILRKGTTQGEKKLGKRKEEIGKINTENNNPNKNTVTVDQLQQLAKYFNSKRNISKN